MAIDLVTNSVFQPGEVFKAKRLGEGIIDFGFTRFTQLSDRDLKNAFLAGEMGGRVFLGERHFDINRGAGHGANQAFLKSGNKTVGTDGQVMTLSGTAFERFTINAANEIDHGGVAILDSARLFNRIARLVFRRDAFDSLINLGIADLNNRAFKRDGGQINGVNLRHDFKRNRCLQVAALFVFVDAQTRGGCNPQIIVFDDFPGRIIERSLQDLTQNLLAIPALDDAGRDLAGTKTGHLDLGSKTGDPLIHFIADFSRCHDKAEFAFETLGAFLGDFHYLVPVAYTMQWGE